MALVRRSTRLFLLVWLVAATSVSVYGFEKHRGPLLHQIHLAPEPKASSIPAPPYDVHRDLPSRYGFFAGDDPSVVKPSSAGQLKKAVEDDYLARAPEKVVHTELRDNVTAFVQDSKYGSGGVYMGIDVLSPKLDTCKTVMSDLTSLDQGIACTNQDTCEYSWSRQISSTYSVELGNKMGATMTLKGGVEGIASVELAVSVEFSFTETWTHAQSDTSTYTFHLKKGERCRPSMFHLDLEASPSFLKQAWETDRDAQCLATPGRFRFDTWWWDSDRKLKLERNYNRGGGPYDDGQWCEEVWMPEDFDQYDSVKRWWKPILASDDHRGLFYQGRASDLNKFGDYGFTDDQLAVRRNFDDRGPNNLIWRCVRAPPLPHEDTQTVVVPLKGSNGELHGYIGCVDGV